MANWEASEMFGVWCHGWFGCFCHGWRHPWLRWVIDLYFVLEFFRPCIIYMLHVYWVYWDLHNSHHMVLLIRYWGTCDMPIIPRIQRLFCCKELAMLQGWHASHKSELGVMRISKNSIAMKRIKDTWLEKIKNEVRSLRLNIAMDDVNPYSLLLCFNS